MSHPNGSLVLRSIVDDVLPDHVKAKYPGIVAAIKVYADFLEHVNKSGFYLNSVDLQRDIDAAESALLIELQKEIGAPIPRQFAADPRKLYKRVSEFYRSRGTPDSIEAFFRVLYNDEVEIYFPKDDILIPSDGKWNSQQTTVIADPTTSSPIFTYTLSSNSNTISGLDDNGKKLIYDNPIVFVDDTYRTDYETQVVVNTSTNKLDYSIVFDTVIPSGAVVHVYRSGSFSNNDGFLSDFKRLQDSFFYQKFSYVLRTGAPIDVWKNAFNRLVHPAGFIFFGEILLFIDSLGQSSPLIQPGFQTGGLPFPIFIPSVDGGATFVKTKNNVLASYYVKEYKVEVHTNRFGPEQWWEDIKLFNNDTFAEIGHYTFEDAKNKRININIQPEIVIE